jgi:hypothetical protein
MPFVETLASSLTIGLSAGKQWTLCLDADVLPLPGAIEALLNYADRLPASCVETQGLVFDRLFGGWRPAGVHLYRTEHLSKALELIGAVEKEIRPETALLDRLAEEGLPWVQNGLAFGLHDFGQTPTDIARKAFVHAWKHIEFVPKLVTYWRSRHEERDFSAALQGLAAGIADPTRVVLDHNHPRYPRLPDKQAGVQPEADDVVQILAREQAIIRQLGFSAAPVYDWAEDLWPGDGRDRRLVRGMCGLLEWGVRGCRVLGDNPATARQLEQTCEAWGIRVQETGCWWQDLESGDNGLPTVSLDSDGSIALTDGDSVRAQFTATYDDSDTKLSPLTAVVSRMLRAGVDECLIYGAGDYARQLHALCAPAGINIVAFIVTHPASHQRTLLGLPVIDLPNARSHFPKHDVLIASRGSIREIAQRLLNDDRGIGHRIWCLYD